VSSVLAFGCDAALVSVGAWSAASVVPSDGSTDATTLDGSGDASSQVSVDAAIGGCCESMTMRCAATRTAGSTSRRKAESCQAGSRSATTLWPRMDSSSCHLSVSRRTTNRALPAHRNQVDIATAGRYIIWGASIRPTRPQPPLVPGWTGYVHLWRIATAKFGIGIAFTTARTITCRRFRISSPAVTSFCSQRRGRAGLGRLYLTAEATITASNRNAVRAAELDSVQGHVFPAADLGGQTAGRVVTAGCSSRRTCTTAWSAVF